MRIFKNKWFLKFANKQRISDEALIMAVNDAENGKIDADYGGGVIKQRIARPGEGKSSGYRSIILYLRGERAFFVYGFAKKDRGNINESDERILKDLAKEMLDATDDTLDRMLIEGDIKEIKNEEE